jgi:hypothetical protein
MSLTQPQLLDRDEGSNVKGDRQASFDDHSSTRDLGEENWLRDGMRTSITTSESKESESVRNMDQTDSEDTSLAAENRNGVVDEASK